MLVSRSRFLFEATGADVGRLCSMLASRFFKPPIVILFVARYFCWETGAANGAEIWFFGATRLVGSRRFGYVTFYC